MLGIIGAMDEEVEKVKGMMTEVVVETIASMDFYKGKLKDKEVVVVRSGICKVNAAICSQILVDRYAVKGIINTGIAGSLRNEINIGDIVLSSDAVQHDVNSTQWGYALGQIPRMDTTFFEADKEWIALAKTACEKVNPEISVHVGRVLSGDQFISDKEKKAWLIETFDGYCAEMEGAAIAQTAHLNQIPFLIIRAISDKADDSAMMDYGEFEAAAITHSVNLITALIEVF